MKKKQVIFTKSNRSDLDTELKKQRSEGNVNTSFCINRELSECLVVMTEMERCEQASGWLKTSNTDGNREREKRLEPHRRRGLVYTIVCQDPSDKQSLHVLTSDEDRSEGEVRVASFFS